MLPPDDNLGVTYFKRFRMEIELAYAPLPTPLPPGYCWVPWDDTLVAAHADVLCASFHEEIDSVVFPSLSNRQGCHSLMGEIRRKHGFLPGATWLLACADSYCGTIQGVCERSGLGAIQNLGVTPEHRGRGLGTALLLQALHGFRYAGLGRVFLEVTAQNDGAVQLYHRVGFRRRKTLYKLVGTAAAL